MSEEKKDIDVGELAISISTHLNGVPIHKCGLALLLSLAGVCEQHPDRDAAYRDVIYDLIKISTRTPNGKEG